MKKLLILSTLLLALLLFPADSSATALNFDEFGTSSLLNADAFSASGVTFHFSAGTAYYDGQIGIGGFAVLVSDPLLSGPTTGTLAMDFDSPTSLLKFNLVLLSMDTIDPAYTVVLSDGTVIVGSTTPQPGGFASEGTFLYTGAPITGATVTFFNGMDSLGGNVTDFGLDNLAFDAPEPSTQLLLAGALLALGVIRKRKILKLTCGSNQRWCGRSYTCAAHLLETEGFQRTQFDGLDAFSLGVVKQEAAPAIHFDSRSTLHLQSAVTG